LSPLYVYRCKNENCLRETEELQKYDISTIACPSCGSESDRIISSTSFVLKGRTWARDGYTNKKNDMKFADN
jgi:putative FmdB family regulatory protein